MERWQSTWENQVEYNLSESGVHPLTLGELQGGADEALLQQHLGYVQTNGTLGLRKVIAGLYENANPENVLVTNGSSEANFASIWSLISPGSEVTLVLPNYMQIWGLCKTFGALVRPAWLHDAHDQWVLDIRSLRRSVSRKTKLIAICNPNNPTGSTLSEGEVDEICGIAKKVRAWILADEVYNGAELNGEPTASFWGRYDKVIVTNGLSKAYGLPGLRLGWIVTSEEQAAKLWSYRDYTTIAPSSLSDHLATKALQPENRNRILQRTQQILKTNLPLLKGWVDRHQRHFSMITPTAGAIALLKYSMKIGSSRLVELLRREKSTLVVPGDHFLMDHYIRVGYGCSRESLIAGLNRIGDWADEFDGQIRG